VTVDHKALIDTLTDILGRSDFRTLGAVFTSDAEIEFPQSGERFRGIDNIRGQFEDYPGHFDGTVRAVDLTGQSPTYALSPSYTVISVGGSELEATATLRVRYPDNSMWWVLLVYETDGQRVRRAKVYFAPDFEPAPWRAKYRVSPSETGGA
jgi:hypothetical protein